MARDVTPPIFPVLTTTQRNALTNLRPGVVIINSSNNHLEYLSDELVWKTIAGT